VEHFVATRIDPLTCEATLALVLNDGTLAEGVADLAFTEAEW
jgi:hypothetical protein